MVIGIVVGVRNDGAWMQTVVGCSSPPVADGGTGRAAGMSGNLCALT